MKRLTRAGIAALIDHTVLAPDTGPSQIDRACDEAQEHGFFAVCVAPTWVRRAVSQLAGSRAVVASVVGFPHGNTLSAVKAFETQQVVAAGAAEVDMVLNVGLLKAGQERLVAADVAAVLERAGGRPVKVILETALLTDAEKERACVIAVDAGAAFVKTSTGFSSAGASVSDVARMRRIVGPDLGVKASGGIRTLAQALALLEVGANRLGCSRSVSIVSGLPPSATPPVPREQS